MKFLDEYLGIKISKTEKTKLKKISVSKQVRLSDLGREGIKHVIKKYQK